MKLVRLKGSHYSMGLQHADALRERRPLILDSIEVRLAELDARQVDFGPRVREVVDAWAAWAPSTLDMLRGIAAGLDLEWEPFVRYTLRSHLLDSLRAGALGQEGGCTTWAAAGSSTRDGQPVLVKNRDFQPVHAGLQFVALATPEHGYPYAYLTSAGSPAVYSSGMNAAGLAVADTHVCALDTGPGVARYSMMMDILERFADVSSALDYLRAVPRMGHGTLTLADALGNLAVAEMTYKTLSVSRAAGFVVSTNHFVSPALADRWLHAGPASSQGNSAGRYTVVERALAAAPGQVDVPFAKALMARHGGLLEALCRHAEVHGDAPTISTVIFEPAALRLHVCDGPPCTAPYVTYQIAP